MLLSTLIEDFEVLPADVDEDSMTLDDPWKTAESIARAKARKVSAIRPAHLVIGADTVVALSERQTSGDDRFVLLGKPIDKSDAARTLARLSGRSHSVVTGVSLQWPGGSELFSETTTVTFRNLTAHEIAEYVATDEPLDKAGGYAIQGGASSFVDHINGPKSNVIGLPLEALTLRLNSATFC